MLDRLVGMETEYAIRCHLSDAAGARASNPQLFRRLLAEVDKTMPTARQLSPLKGRFIVNGGRVHLEASEVAVGDPKRGLVEASTPECRGPRQLLLYQRAQDTLLADASRGCQADDCAITLIKNNRDGEGEHYGSHENYEATVASGPALWLWRIGLIFAVPSILLGLVLIGLVIHLLPHEIRVPVIVLLCAVILCSCYPAQAGFRSAPRTNWLRLVVVWTLVLPFLFPLLLGTTLLVRLVAFRKIRRELLAFLVSRPVFAGAGGVSLDGSTFMLSVRAETCRCVCGVASELGRPIFYFGHVTKAFIALLFERHRFYHLFRARQRFQVACGDSNMAQTAEYLKIGTTLLVLDAIEAGELADVPLLRRPMQALRDICADTSLQATVPLSGGRSWTALQIQRFYLEACERFVRRSASASQEAWEILALWRDTLDALEQEPERLIGQIDWITKRYLLDRAGDDAPPAMRRKIDLRYHELAHDGYFAQLEANGVASVLVDADEVRKAIQMPPSRSPAATRSRYIREFSGGNVALKVGWESIMLGPDKVISLNQYRDLDTSHEEPVA